MITEQSRKVTDCVIKPFVPENGKDSVGLYKYNMVIHDGTYHVYELACLENGGQKRYSTGLNEFDLSLKDLPDEQRKAKIKQIREDVSRLEYELNQNKVDPEDDNFWSKVKLLDPKNEMFWSSVLLKVSNNPTYLDPKNPMDFIKIKAIEAGGFPDVAPSFESAKAAVTSPKFYFDRAGVAEESKLELPRLRNKAGALLEELADTDPIKLLYVLKVVDANSAQYKKNTPAAILYKNTVEFIDGKGNEKNKRICCESFINAYKMNMEDLTLKALIKDATFYKLITAKSDGYIYHIKSSTMMGRNPSDCIEFLKNAVNDDVYKDIRDGIEYYWNS